MTYREIAKCAIREYASIVVKEGYTFSDYESYRETFYTILAEILRLNKERTKEEYKGLKASYRKVLKDSDLLRRMKQNKEISYNIVKAMFDIVVKELQENDVSYKGSGVNNDL